MNRTIDPEDRGRQKSDDGTADTLRMLLPAVYFEHFTLDEFRFRWADIISTDPSPSARMHHAAMTIALRNFDSLGSAHPRVDTIAAGMHVTVNTARTALHELEEHGWLHIEKRSGTSNLYQALLPSTCEPAIVEVASSRRRDKPTSNTLAVAHTLAVGLLGALGVTEDNSPALPRIRGQISQILATAADVEIEAGFVMRYVLDELPRTVNDPVKICHKRLGEYAKRYAKGRKKPEIVSIDPDRAEVVRNIIQQAVARMRDPNRPGL